MSCNFILTQQHTLFPAKDYGSSSMVHWFGHFSNLYFLSEANKLSLLRYQWCTHTNNQQTYISRLSVVSGNEPSDIR